MVAIDPELDGELLAVVAGPVPVVVPGVVVDGIDAVLVVVVDALCVDPQPARARPPRRGPIANAALQPPIFGLMTHTPGCDD